MTPTTEFAAAAIRATDAKVTGLVSAAHFVSHFYIIVLAPVFPVVRAEFGVSYTELGLAIALFNVVSAALQTPAGFLVDRVSARAVLTGGLVLGAGALALAGLSPSFWFFVAMFGLAGLGNTVYHPADYALLSQRISSRFMSRAYSIHTFAGMLGTAVAPATMLFLQAGFGWRGAFLTAAMLGFGVAALLIMAGDALAGPAPGSKGKPVEAAGTNGGTRLLLSPVILLNLLFFALLALTNSGMQNYSVVALEALRGTSLALANTALTAFLLMAAFGVLAGGFVTTRTSRYDVIAVGGLALSGAAMLAVAFTDAPPLLLIALMAMGGLFNGIIMPSRDMLVRAVTPPGAFGKVFGFVTSGFNIGGIIGPFLFGWFMDHGSPRAVLIGAAACSLLAIPAVMVTVAHGRIPASAS